MSYPVFIHCYTTSIIDLPIPIIPSNAITGFEGCNITTDNSSGVTVACHFPTNPSITGILIILRFSDEDTISVNRSQDASSPVTLRGANNGTHHVTVFPLLENVGIIGTSVLYSEIVELISFDTDGMHIFIIIPNTCSKYGACISL